MHLTLINRYRLWWLAQANLIAFLLIGMAHPVAAQTVAPVNFRLYLIGDAGKLTVQQASFKAFLQHQIKADTVPSAIVFLGDNIYPSGMPHEGHRKRKQTEQILAAQLALAEGFKGDIIFVPGNHDWKKGKREGLNYILNQQAWIDSLKKENVKMVPGNGCPGPIEIELAKNLVLVVIDTQWWLHPWDKPKDETSTCDAKTEADIIIQLDDILHRNSGKRVVVAGHHPLVTYGDHGGYFSAADHLFPLTNLNKNLYIPMPVLGSIYPLYRKIFGDIQDMAHPQYKRMANALNKLLSQYPGVVYASGHDHSLQYASNKGVHYVVSGSGVNSSNVKKGKLAEFVSAEPGYVRMSVSKDTEAQLEYITNASIPFQKTIAPLPVIDKAVVMDSISNAGRVSVNASNRYVASRSRERWLGKNYRAEWSQKIDIPVFDLGKEMGGLKILQRGGGRQTSSLRLQDSLGKEYTLRSIEKFPEKALPEALRQTFAEDLVQDQISAAHPYAAVVIPLLAEAAGIYHTNPKVVYIPDDPRLGIYRNDFAHQVMLLEERASGNGHAMDFFGNADAMISSAKMLEQLMKDNDNTVDQKFFLRSRLFDMWIGDWDRHEDQWRWAVFESKKGKTYRPIPRDRDQAFFVNEGRIPKFIAKPFLLFQFEGFNDKVRWPSGLMFSGRFIDRSFLTALSREDWLKEADALALQLSDQVIDSALRQWPEEIYNIHGTEIARKLKARRATLRNDALKHYLFLAKQVSIAGSNKREKFVVEHRNDTVSVKMFKLSKEGEPGRLLYEREFLKEETQEIRLYGLGGDDQFEVMGRSDAIKIRMIGGDGDDQVQGQGKKIEVYDAKGGITLTDNAVVKVRTSTDPAVNEYNWRDYRYNRTAPLIYLNYNVDDGVFLGGGLVALRHGFRKSPFKSRHLVLASYAINTSSYNFQYDGVFTGVIGKWDLKIDADIKAPNYVNNFFGWGNESVFDKKIDAQPGIDVDKPIDYYRVRYQEIKLQMQVAKKIGQWGFVKAGPVYQRIEIENAIGKDRYINEYALATPVLEEGKNFGGLTYAWGIDKRNHPTLTTRGVYLEQQSQFMRGFSLPDFTSHNAVLSFYQSFRFPAIVTFAWRAGAGVNTGRYEFYQAQVLDGKTELRGFRKTRFYGDKKLYFNNEVRIKLGSIQSYLFPAHIGILGFYDVGRIWYKDETGIDPTSLSGTSTEWHKGFGGGLWFTPFNLTTVSTEVGHSVEGTLVYVRLGFMF